MPSPQDGVSGIQTASVPGKKQPGTFQNRVDAWFRATYRRADTEVSYEVPFHTLESVAAQAKREGVVRHLPVRPGIFTHCDPARLQAPDLIMLIVINAVAKIRRDVPKHLDRPDTFIIFSPGPANNKMCFRVELPKRQRSHRWAH